MSDHQAISRGNAQPWHGWLVALALGLAAVAIVGACSTPAASAPAASVPAVSSPGAPAGDTVCADADALRSAVDELRALDVAAVGTNGLNAAVDDVQEAAAALRTSVGSEFSQEVGSVETSVAALRTAVQQVPEGSVGAAAGGIQAAITDVGTSVEALGTELQSARCPG